MNTKILDCTLRDGGYYTNWDFPPDLVDTYVNATNALPVDFIEVGYCSPAMDSYRGQFFYCPEFVLEALKDKTVKQIAVMLNEKDVPPDSASSLMNSRRGLVDLVRLAVNPDNIERATGLAEALKNMGFRVAMNLMYLSTWKDRTDFLNFLPNLDPVVDYVSMVDSFGGAGPSDVREAYEIVASRIDVDVGFHGHNNLELALINSLIAIDCGAKLVDCTFTGMGRGAGNLKTELLLTVLNANHGMPVDFSALSEAVFEFEQLKKRYEWGTNLPYMVSGANSLPQKDVMSWISKRFLSLESIVRALENKTKGLEDNYSLKKFDCALASREVLLVGGGPSVQRHADGLRTYISARPDTAIVFASSRNVKTFAGLPNLQIHCLSGNEGQRLKSTFDGTLKGNRELVLGPYPRTMGTYIPEAFINRASELQKIDFTTDLQESVTAIVLQTAIELGAKKVGVVGYDGYGLELSKYQMELFQENETLFNRFSAFTGLELFSLTETDYENLNQGSLYSTI